MIPGLDALCLPKVDSADHVLAIDEVVGELEAERGLPAGHVRYAVLVETAKGVHEARAIAKASPPWDTAPGHDWRLDPIS